MDLNWDVEQVELRESLRRFLARPDGKAGADRGRHLLFELGDLGVLGLSVPERSGGSGAGLVTDMVFFEELGRALAGGLVFSTAALAVPLVCASSADLARDIVAGRCVAAVAWASSSAEYHLQAGGADLDAEPTGRSSARLTGTMPLVPGASGADVLTIVAGGTTPNVYVVDPSAAGVAVRPRTPLDPSTPLADVTLRQASAVALLDDSTAASAISKTLDRAVLLAGAEIVGIAEAVLGLSLRHATIRTQFGRPVGAYQAVSHPIVDIYAESELARSLGLLAASLLEDTAGPRSAVLSGFAMSTATLGIRACEVAIQVHGGLGMTWESPLHRFYKRAKVLRSLIGPQSLHRTSVLAHLTRLTG